MLTAVTVFQGKVAPVLEEARHLLFSEGAGKARTLLRLEEVGMAGRPEALKTLGVGTLVCGALCRETEARLRRAGIRLVSFVSGEAKEVLEAVQLGRLDPVKSRLPGCGWAGLGRSGGARARARCRCRRRGEGRSA